jgi:divalent metal cation (Fe/Co/Zn/Cd) transporter
VSLRQHRPLPSAQQALMRRAVRLEIATVVAMSAVAVIVYLSAGNSQTMKTAWIEDVLSLVPPIASLAATRFSRKPPDEEYVNGRWRAFDVSFLVSAVALTGVGIGLVYDGLHALLTRTHPSVGAVDIGGTLLWQGWVMIGALLLSLVPPMVLGRMKLKLARELHLKPLHTDADMNKADWMTGLAGVAGIAGIGMGWWWADAAAALFISGSVLHDGVSNLRHAVRDLHDARPETTERGRGDPLVGRVREALSKLDWVEHADVRLHEEGMRVSGVLIVRPRDGRALRTRLHEAEQTARSVHWRIDEVTATFGGEDPNDGNAEERRDATS